MRKTFAKCADETWSCRYCWPIHEKHSFGVYRRLYLSKMAWNWCFKVWLNWSKKKNLDFASIFCRLYSSMLNVNCLSYSIFVDGEPANVNDVLNFVAWPEIVHLFGIHAAEIVSIHDELATCDASVVLDAVAILVLRLLLDHRFVRHPSVSLHFQHHQRLYTQHKRIHVPLSDGNGRLDIRWT